MQRIIRHRFLVHCTIIRYMISIVLQVLDNIITHILLTILLPPPKYLADTNNLFSYVRLNASCFSCTSDSGRSVQEVADSATLLGNNHHLSDTVKFSHGDLISTLASYVDYQTGSTKTDF